MVPAAGVEGPLPLPGGLLVLLQSAGGQQSFSAALTPSPVFPTIHFVPNQGALCACVSARTVKHSDAWVFLMLPKPEKPT